MAKRKSSAPKKQAEARAQLVRQALLDSDLSGIRLAHCSCSHMLKDGELPNVLANELIHAEADVSKKHGFLVYTMHFQVVGDYDQKTTGKSTTKPKGEPPFQIDAVFQALYDVNPKTKLSEDELEASMSSFGLMNAWPYWREFVQSITTRMALPPLTLPLLKIPSTLVHLEQLKPSDLVGESSKRRSKKKAAPKKSPPKKKARRNKQ